MTTNHAEWNSLAVCRSETRRERSDRLFREAGRRMSLADMEKRNRRADEKRGEPSTCRAREAHQINLAGRYRRMGLLPSFCRSTLARCRYWRNGPVLP